MRVLLALAIIFLSAPFALADIGVGLSYQYYDASLAVNEDYFFTFTAYNTGTEAGDYNVSVYVGGMDISEIFDVKFSDREFPLPANNASKPFWVSLKPKLSAGSYNITVLLTRRPNKVEAGSSPIIVRSTAVIKTRLVKSLNKLNGYEEPPAWFTGKYPEDETPIINPALLPPAHEEETPLVTPTPKPKPTPTPTAAPTAPQETAPVKKREAGFDITKNLGILLILFLILAILVAGIYLSSYKSKKK